ncbi:PAS domain-containing protein [Blastococcus colisei]|uniref:PAS domain-containing protein n=1 Tax=Blastococcus colisei TaxID=1564162 RepID=UPI0014772054|nr:PAS domain-containing protein [Blastococcus colisei]
MHETLLTGADRPTGTARDLWSPEGENQFRLFVSSVRDYDSSMLDFDGRAVSWNAGARHIQGYEAEEILGRSFEVFYPEGDRAWGFPERHPAAPAAWGELRYEGWRLPQDGSRF